MPKKITSYFTGLPSLNVTRAIIPIEHNIMIPQKDAVQNSDVTHGVVLDNLTSECVHVSLFDSNCGNGPLCNQQEAFKNGVRSSTCACYTTSSNKRTAGVAMDIILTQQDGHQLEINSFSSASFQRDYVFRNGMPPGIGAGELGSTGTLDIDIGFAIDSVMGHVNGRGGWTAIPWVKPGLVRDQATISDPTQYNAAAPVLVESGTLTYHLVSMRPTVPSDLNLAQLNGFKINIEDHM